MHLFYVTPSPLGWLWLHVCRIWWMWAHHDSMLLDKAAPHISEQIQAINDIDNRLNNFWKR